MQVIKGAHLAQRQGCSPNIYCIGFARRSILPEYRSTFDERADQALQAAKTAVAEAPEKPPNVKG